MKEKVGMLISRIATLEKFFEKPPSDEEKKFREELLRYVSSLRPDLMLKPFQ